MILLEVVLPLLVLMGLGFLLGRLRHTDPQPLSDVTLYILLPILLFTSLVHHLPSGMQAVQLFAWYFGLVFLLWLVIALIAYLATWERVTRSAVLLGLTGFNMASYDLPVALFALGEHSLSIIMILVVASNIHMATFGVYIAASGQQEKGRALASVFKMPLIHAIWLALLVHALDLTLPARLLSLAEMVGRAAPPLGMIVLGIQISTIPLRSSEGMAVLYGGAISKIFIVPVLGILFALSLGTEDLIRDTLLLGACLPTAINYLLLSVRFDVRPDLVGGILFLSTLISPFTIALVLWFID